MRKSISQRHAEARTLNYVLGALCAFLGGFLAITLSTLASVRF